MKRGFTLVEIMVTIGIFAVLSTLTSLNFFSTYSQSNLSAAKDVLVADLKTRQANAMTGLGDTAWDPSQTALPSNITLTTTFPSNQVSFLHSSGEIGGYTAGQNTLTLSSVTDSQTISLNQYGTVIGD